MNRCKLTDLAPDQLDEALNELEARGICPRALVAWKHAKGLMDDVASAKEDGFTDRTILKELNEQRENDMSDDEFVDSYYSEVITAARMQGLLE